MSEYVKSENTRHVKMTPERRQRAYIMHKEHGVSYAEIGRTFGVQAATISKIVKEVAMERSGD